MPRGRKATLALPSFASSPWARIPRTKLKRLPRTSNSVKLECHLKIRALYLSSVQKNGSHQDPMTWLCPQTAEQYPWAKDKRCTRGNSSRHPWHRWAPFTAGVILWGVLCDLVSDHVPWCVAPVWREAGCFCKTAIWAWSLWMSCLKPLQP